MTFVNILRLLVLFIFLFPTVSQADQWKETALPDYAKTLAFPAIGSDGLIYNVSSNENGYVFEAVLEKYRFEAATTNGFSGTILARQDTIYLGAGCDALTPDFKGSWASDTTGLNFRVDGNANQVMTFRLLSTGLTPHHSC